MSKSKPELIRATLVDYPLIENMWRFYVYDMGRYCGFNEGWECPTSLSFVPDDLTRYFVDQTRKAFLVKVDDEIAGFVFLNKVGTKPEVDWNIGEFFIIGKYQGKGIAEQVAVQIFKKFPGVWEATVIQENERALGFWRKVISHYTNGHFLEEIKVVDWARRNPKRVVFYFNSKNKWE
ncbi:MAG TPA: GNAT family N-acetyltransferase [Alphaproteobacteria bacterium]|nr:GNAT family N-acetyltransferase [Alphaproteobacteria bacterium]